MRLSAAIDAFVEDVCAGKTNETPSAYRAKLRCLLEFAGDRAVSKIAAEDLEKFRKHLLNRKEKMNGRKEVKAPLSVWYVRGILRTTKQLCKWLFEHGHVRRNPAAGLKLPAKPQPRPKPIEPDTFERLLEAARSTGEEWQCARNVALLCCLRDTGGRIGGLLDARLSGLDLEAGTLTTIEKGNQMHVLFLNQGARFALEQWIGYRRLRETKTDHIFTSEHGKGLTRSGVYMMMRRLAVAAELKDVRYNPHAFRHAFARDTLRAGADLSEVSQLMHHSTIAVTADYYAIWLPSELQDVHRRASPGVLIGAEHLKLFDKEEPDRRGKTDSRSGST